MWGREMPKRGDYMTKETISQSQQGNAVSVSTNQKAVSKKNETNGETKKVLKKEEQHFKNEFEENNQKEKRKEEEKELQDIANCKEVIDALFGVREAAEKAVAHMEGVPADGEDIEDLLLKQNKLKSAHDFLNYMSLIGMKEAKKKKKKEAHKSPYNDFIQLNNNKIGSLIDLVDKNPQAMKVLLWIQCPCMLLCCTGRKIQDFTCNCLEACQISERTWIHICPKNRVIKCLYTFSRIGMEVIWIKS